MEVGMGPVTSNYMTYLRVFLSCPLNLGLCWSKSLYSQERTLLPGDTTLVSLTWKLTVLQVSCLLFPLSQQAKKGLTILDGYSEALVDPDYQGDIGCLVQNWRGAGYIFYQGIHWGIS